MPHHLTLRPGPDDTTVEAQVARIVPLGLGVCVQLDLAAGGTVEARITRDEAEQLELRTGDILFVCAPAAIVTRPSEDEPAATAA